MNLIGKKVFQLGIQLSKRLQAVASFVERGAIVADIGSDHAYLPTYLVQQGVVQKAIVGEVVIGPFESALKNVKRHGFTDSITVRLASGLSAIEEVDGVDTVTIAGMGGALIASILNEGKDRLENVQHIIAQPNIHAQAVREWAAANGWMITKEQILKEDGKIYEIIVLEKGQSSYDELALLLGPYLLEEKNDVFYEKWTSEIVQWTEVLRSIEHAMENQSIEEKKQQLTRRIRLVGEVLKE